MGGYNTLSEVLSLGKSALVVPRTSPRTEQLIRADRFAQLGLIDVLHPDDASPQAISDWFGRAPASSAKARQTIDFAGLDRLPLLIDDLVRGSSETRSELAQTAQATAIGSPTRPRTRAGVSGR